MYKTTKIATVLLAAAALLSSCNDIWKDEQYENYVSLKAPLDTQGNSVGVTSVYVPWTRLDDQRQPLYGQEGLSHYNLSVIVAGSLTNPNNLQVNIAHSDTLPILNRERFGHREEIYYSDMWDYADVPATVTVPAGENVVQVRIPLDFNRNGGIDLLDRYVLPVTVAPGEGYERHPRKNYATAMLRILPYNDFTGAYSGTNMLYCIVDDEGNAEGSSTALQDIQSYACGSYKMFFYAGTNDEKSLLRKNFRIYAEFTPDAGFQPSAEVLGTGTMKLYVDPAENPELNFRQTGIATYKIIDEPDEQFTFITRRMVIIQDVEYFYSDTKTAPGSKINYKVAGTMIMERKLNTQMPEEDQIIF